MTALMIMFTCLIILFNLGPILNKLFEPKNHVKKYKVQEVKEKKKIYKQELYLETNCSTCL